MSDLYTNMKQVEEEESIRDMTASEDTLLGRKREGSLCESKRAGMFACEVEGCDKMYTQKYRLQIHMRTHTGEKPYICQVCSRGFTEKGNLKVHERIHTGQRPYKCEFEGCGKGFKAFGQLKDHQNMHMDQREFKCELCPAKFNRKSTLKMHMLIHTNEKPFLCPYESCGRTFREKSNMNKHFKIHVKKDKATKTFPQSDCALKQNKLMISTPKIYESADFDILSNSTLLTPSSSKFNTEDHIKGVYTGCLFSQCFVYENISNLSHNSNSDHLEIELIGLDNLYSHHDFNEQFTNQFNQQFNDQFEEEVNFFI